MALIECKNLTFGYEGNSLTKPLNFSVNQGDYFCIVGENGAGKTTLMKTLLSLQQPISGSIITGDGLKSDEIGYLPQHTQVQKDFPASVREIVLSGCQSRAGFFAFYGQKDKELADRVMNKLGIYVKRNRCYRNLSGGMQQRVLLARALCATQKLLLLDEPTAGLDPIVTADMYRLIEKLNKEDGITVIMITHDVEAAVRYANKILHMGVKNFYGSRDEYINSDTGRLFIESMRGEYNE